MASEGERRLLVWDAPNMDRCLSEVIGQRASAVTRPNLAAVLAWARGRSGGDDTVEACVFCTVPSGLEAAMVPWVVNLRHSGFAVFAKPTLHRAEVVVGDIVRHVERRFSRGSLVELLVACHDAKAVTEPLHRWATAGVDVAVLGYREKATFASTSPALAFVDLEEIPEAFERPLPRTNLFDLPTGGRWFDPFPPDEAPPVSRPRARDGRRSAGGGRPSTNGAPAATLPRPPGPASSPGTVGPDEGATDEPAVGGRNAVVAVVAAEVSARAAAGLAGMTVRQAGDLVRARFAPRSLAQLGFDTVGDLIDTLEANADLLLVRLPDGGHLLTVGTDLVVPATAVGVAGSEPGAPGDAAAARPTDTADPRTERADPPVPHGGDPSPRPLPDRPANGRDHPIYRAFRVRRPA